MRITGIRDEDRQLLKRWSASRTLAARAVQRSRIVLLLADGRSVKDVAARMSVSPATVRLWRQRFLAHGPTALLNDAPGRGRKPVLNEALRESLQGGLPTGDAKSVRERARELGVSAATVSRWRRRVE